MEAFLEQFLQSVTAGENALLSPSEIPFDAAVRQACASNACGRYGTCWTCPPGAGDWQALRAGFLSWRHAFVYNTVHPLEDSFDVEGMTKGRKEHDESDKLLLDLARKAGIPCELAGAGSCTLCSRCTYPDAPCRHPDKARRSMEACGIDVVSLSRLAGMRYIHGQDTVTYFSVLFF